MLEFRRFALCLAAFLLLTHEAAAAEVSVVQLEVYDNLSNLSIDVDSGIGNNLANDGQIRCNYLLHGEIKTGDLDRLKAAIGPFANRDADSVPRLCLHSPGGSYSEGMAIAQYLMAENIGTAVPQGANCYSACAFMFMGGSYPWKGQINRFVHVLGNLGFHAPYLGNLPDEKYDKALVAEAYAEGIKAMRTLMELGVGDEVKRFPPELMQELMGKGPDEFFMLDTVGKAIRFRVHLYGSKLSLPLDDRTYCNVCINMRYGAWESYGQGAENDICNGTVPDVKAFPEGRRLVYGAPRGGTCGVDLKEQGGKLVEWMYAEDEEAKWRDGLELAYWYLYPPNAAISTLSDGQADLSLSRADGSIVELPPFQSGDGGSGGSSAIDALVDFVALDYLGHGKANHETPEQAFADEVEYYGKRITRAKVAQDHRAYYHKWPQRTYQVVSKSMNINVTSPETADVEFTYAFTVANGIKTVSGIGQTELSLRIRDGRHEITRENGKVVSRK